MKIAFITPDYPPDILGGAGISSMLLVKQLIEQNIEVEVFVFNKKHPTTTYLGAKTHYFSHLKKLELTTINVSTFLNFRKYYDKFDLIHVYNVKQMPALSILKKDIPVVATLNNLELACLNTIKNLKIGCNSCGHFKSFLCSAEYLCRRYNKKYLLAAPIYWAQFNIAQRLSQRIDRFFALSENVKWIYVNSGFSKEKIKTIPCMADPIFCSEKKTKEDRLTILFSGRFDAPKGALNLINAYSMLPKKMRDKTRLILLGRGIEEEKYRRLIRERQLDKNIQIKYVRYNELPDTYKKADILVHPAIFPEPFSRTRLEAMASGTVILSSRHPSSEEILGDCALFFDAFNIKDLKDKLEILIENEDLRKKLSKKGKKELKKYMPKKVVPKIIKEYKLVLAN